MESYPAELVKCVSPLVFVANAILPDDNKTNNVSNNNDVSSSSVDNEGETASLDNDDMTTTATTATSTTTTTTTSHKVSENDMYFQSFLGCITTNHATPSQINTTNTTTNPSNDEYMYGQCNPGQVNCKPFDPLTAILSLDPLQVGTTNNNTTTDTNTSNNDNNSSSDNNNNADTSSSTTTNNKKQSFFTHARMIPVSNRHALPPSKDPSGKNNTISRLNTALGRTLPFSTSIPTAFQPLASSVVTGERSTSAQGTNYNTTKTGSNTNTYYTQLNSMTSTLATNPNLNSSSSSSSINSTTQKQIQSILTFDPINGILPTGWLEKHAHALPSTILIVTKIDLGWSLYQQAQCETFLGTTIQNIGISCAEKRNVPLHLVCLVVDSSKKSGTGGGGTVPSASGGSSSNNSVGGGMGHVVTALEQERIGNIKTICRIPVTALHVRTADLPEESSSTTTTTNTSATATPTLPSTPSFITTTSNLITDTKNKISYLQSEYKSLEKSISQSSNAYYLNQVKRVKKKHSALYHEKVRELLPIAARYCFKIGMFYEYMYDTVEDSGSGGFGGTRSVSGGGVGGFYGEKVGGGSEKSLKYWKEAYANVLDYYQCLITGRDASYVMSTTNNDMVESDAAGGISSGVTNSPGDAQILDEEQLKHRNKLRSSRALVEDADDEEEDDDDDDDTSSTEDDTQQSINTPMMDDSTIQTSDDLNSLPPPPPPPPSSEDDGVEVALVYSPKSGSHKSSISEDIPSTPTGGSSNTAKSTYSEDMIHQCRGVADWLNFKILTILYMNAITGSGSSYSSASNDGSTEEGSVQNKFAMISKQMRRHRQIFISTRSPVLSSSSSLTTSSQLEGNDMKKDDRSTDPAWYYWKYVAHQRLVLAQLIERNPILASTISSSSQHEYYPPNNELRECHAIVHYVAAGESLLRLASCIKMKHSNSSGVSTTSGNGDSSALAHTINHAKSSESIKKRQRFVGGLGRGDLASMFQKECNHDHYALAFQHLSKALELLNEDQTDSKTMYDMSISPARIHYLISGILILKHNYEGAAKQLRQALDSSKMFPALEYAIEKTLIYALKRCSTDYSEQIGKMSIFLAMKRMVNSCLEMTEFDQILRDAVTMCSSSSSSSSSSSKGSAIATDKVIEWKSIEEEMVPFVFSLTFPEVRHAIEGDVVPVTLLLQSKLKTSIRIDCIKVHTNTGTVSMKDITTGVKSNILLRPEELHCFPGKLFLSSNISKESTPLQKDPPFGKSNTSGLTAEGGCLYALSSNNGSNSPLGGICIFCMALEIGFEFLAYPDRQIAMKIPNAHCGSLTKVLPNQKPIVEEDDYLSSAWDRPSNFSFSSGPRCLRMLSPRPDLQVTNLTYVETNGNVLEGTINRILLELKAGSTEICRDVKMSVVCDSSILQPDGENEQKEDSSSVLVVRCPILVKPLDPISEGSSQEVSESHIPVGWGPYGGPMSQGSNETKTSVVDSLKYGSTAHCSFDLFRPLPENIYSVAGSDGNRDVMCKTNFVVTLTYRQIRPNHAAQIRSHGDLVTKHHSSSVIWSQPIQAETAVSLGPKKMYTSGNRHSSNQISNKVFAPEALVDGEPVILKCSLKGTKATEDGLAVKVDCVTFDMDQADKGCDMELVEDNSTKIARNVMFSPKPNDICHILRKGTKLNISSTLRPKMTKHDQDFITSSLGQVIVNWTSMSLSSPSGIRTNINDQFKDYHGPLSIQNSQPIRCYSPVCHIESTPFETSTTIEPPLPKVLTPFQVRYVVTNKTKQLQHLKISMRDIDKDILSSGMLISGVLDGDISLGPKESKVLRYSVLVTRVGKISLPVMSVSSTRYNSWVIRTTDETFFVTP